MTVRMILGGLCLFALGLMGAMASAAGPSHAVYRTTDRGRSWSRADEGLPGQARINAFAAIGGAVLTGTDAGVFVSVDEGRRWQAASGVASTSGRILSLATAGDRVYAGTDRSGVLVSVDQGQTWSRSAGFPAPYVRSLLGDGAAIYAGTDKQGVYSSEDGGVSWVGMSDGLPADGQIFTMTKVKGTLFAGLYAKGLWSFQEGLRRWVRVGEVVPLVLAPAGGTLIVGHNPGGLLWSADLGRTWGQGRAAGAVAAGGAGELTQDAPVWEAGAGDGIVYAGAAEGIYYSEDEGRSWTRARGGLPAVSSGIAFLGGGGFALAGVVVRGE
ncbi:WD40/YVTN/BNR-like repeat-containing protein [Paludibaculum fermentans]|uniref:WD40/YVTN/BNR-like repeat-containing protein n=1 Tax=Paludibaculum fermentans TaxID=1473598 RepID=UPI003EBC2CE2